jgi:O-antigen ligase
MLVLIELACAVALFLLAVPVARRPQRGTLAWLGFLGFSAAGLLSGLVHGSSVVRAGLLVGPVAVTGMVLLPRPSLAWFESRFRWVLRAYAFGSLAVAVFAPSWALAHSHQAGVIPGLTTRLAGLAPHPNALGPMMAVLLILEWRAKPRSAVVMTAAAVAVAWSQSKTTLAVIAVVAAVAGYRRLRSVPAGGRSTWLPIILLAVVVGASGYYALGPASPERPPVDRTDVSAETFTGRTAIWQATLEVWRANPLVGYGPDLWGDAMDRRYRYRVGFPPGHAHNQLIQTLGDSGLVGAVALAVYLVGLGGLARAGDRRTLGYGALLFVILVLRSFTEVPLRGATLSTDFLLHMGTFGYLLIGANEKGENG